MRAGRRCQLPVGGRAPRVYLPAQPHERHTVGEQVPQRGLISLSQVTEGEQAFLRESGLQVSGILRQRTGAAGFGQRVERGLIAPDRGPLGGRDDQDDQGTGYEHPAGTQEPP
jgi:hypothetical protein